MTILDHYPKPAIDMLMNFLSTHDTERALTRLAGDEIGWNGKDWQAERCRQRSAVYVRNLADEVRDGVFSSSCRECRQCITATRRAWRATAIRSTAAATPGDVKTSTSSSSHGSSA